MSKELIVSSTAHETKVAILEDDDLVEVYFERERQYGLAGSIYKGRVTRVLPGMQSAFVNIGLERDAFLYVSDFFEDTEEYDRIVTTVEDKIVKMEEKAAAEREDQPVPAGSGAEAASAPAAPPEEEGPPSPPRYVDEDRLSRWGRRGRRNRRGRRVGRGFPESKFVSRASAVSEAAPVMEDFQVLPGESLAKYRHPVEAPAEPQIGAAEAEVRDAGTAAVEERPAEEAAAVGYPSEFEEEISGPSGAPVEPELEPAAEAATGKDTEAAMEPPIEEETGAGTASEPETAPESEIAPESEGASELDVGSQEEVAPEAPQEQAEFHSGLDSEPPAERASVRERPFGRRYLHRGGRRMRRGAGRGRIPREDYPEAPPLEAAAGARLETSITDLLKEGQEIIVQIAKEPLGKKGARITSHIALPGRYLVYMPTVDHVGVSRKIQSEEERHRLKRIVQATRVGMPGGFIVRTAGEGQSEEEIRSDMHFLYNLWLDLRQKAERTSAPALIHHDLNVVERILRDQLTESFKTIWVDSQDDYERILQFVERFQPKLVGRVKLYTRSNPIFDEFGITQELEKALRPKVWLKSGGYIVINQTEALVAIDVNTGKYVGKSNRLEDTIVKTNTDAVKEIARQIRLRDLGGIIVVDFIDMDERKNRQKVMQALDEALRRDRSPTKILQFNDFGLVAITRKRVKQSLERTLCTPCPYCDGSGYVKSATTVVLEILTEAKKITHNLEGRNVVLRVSPDVAKLLKSRENSYLEELEAIVRRSVIIRSDPNLHQERFDFN